MTKKVAGNGTDYKKVSTVKRWNWRIAAKNRCCLLDCVGGFVSCPWGRLGLQQHEQFGRQLCEQLCEQLREQRPQQLRLSRGGVWGWLLKVGFTDFGKSFADLWGQSVAGDFRRLPDAKNTFQTNCASVFISADLSRRSNTTTFDAKFK